MHFQWNHLSNINVRLPVLEFCICMVNGMYINLHVEVNTAADAAIFSFYTLSYGCILTWFHC